MKTWGERICSNRQLGVRVYIGIVIIMVLKVNSATSENMVVKSTIFHYHNIHNCTWTSPDGKTHYHIYNILIGAGILIYTMYEP
jgi:hypothetical protein